MWWRLCCASRFSFQDWRTHSPPCWQESCRKPPLSALSKTVSVEECSSTQGSPHPLPAQQRGLAGPCRLHLKETQSEPMNLGLSFLSWSETINKNNPKELEAFNTRSMHGHEKGYGQPEMVRESVAWREEEHFPGAMCWSWQIVYSVFHPNTLKRHWWRWSSVGVLIAIFHNFTRHKVISSKGCILCS